MFLLDISSKGLLMSNNSISPFSQFKMPEVYLNEIRQESTPAVNLEQKADEVSLSAKNEKKEKVKKFAIIGTALAVLVGIVIKFVRHKVDSDDLNDAKKGLKVLANGDSDDAGKLLDNVNSDDAEKLLGDIKGDDAGKLLREGNNGNKTGKLLDTGNGSDVRKTSNDINADKKGSNNLNNKSREIGSTTENTNNNPQKIINKPNNSADGSNTTSSKDLKKSRVDNSNKKGAPKTGGNTNNNKPANNLNSNDTKGATSSDSTTSKLNTDDATATPLQETGNSTSEVSTKQPLQKITDNNTASKPDAGNTKGATSSQEIGKNANKTDSQPLQKTGDDKPVSNLKPDNTKGATSSQQIANNTNKTSTKQPLQKTTNANEANKGEVLQKTDNNSTASKLGANDTKNTGAPQETTNSANLETKTARETSNTQEKIPITPKQGQVIKVGTVTINPEEILKKLNNIEKLDSKSVKSSDVQSGLERYKNKVIELMNIKSRGDSENYELLHNLEFYCYYVQDSIKGADETYTETIKALRQGLDKAMDELVNKKADELRPIFDKKTAAQIVSENTPYYSLERQAIDKLRNAKRLEELNSTYHNNTDVNLAHYIISKMLSGETGSFAQAMKNHNIDDIEKISAYKGGTLGKQTEELFKLDFEMPDNFTTCVQFPISKEMLGSGEELIIEGTEKLKKGAIIDTNGSYLIHDFPNYAAYKFSQEDGFITAVLDVPANTKSIKLRNIGIREESVNILEPGKIQVESFDPRTSVLHGKYIV